MTRPTAPWWNGIHTRFASGRLVGRCGFESRRGHTTDETRAVPIRTGAPEHPRIRTMSSASEGRKPEKGRKRGPAPERLVIREEDVEQALDRFLGKKPKTERRDEGDEEPERDER